MVEREVTDDDTLTGGDEPTEVVGGNGHARAVPAVAPEPYIDPGPSYAQEAPVPPAGPVARRRALWIGPFDDFWPAVSVLLLAALIGLGIAWYVTQQSEKAVPSVTLLPLEQAVSRLQDDGFKVDIVNRPGGTKAGVVFEQTPSAGAEVDEGSTVTVVVSKGRSSASMPSVPNVVGTTQEAARSTLEAAGFTVRVFAVASSQPVGTVIAQRPASGERAQKGVAVRINVSKGPGLVPVPSLVGLTQGAAQARLTDIGLTADVTEVPSDRPPGTVVAQAPAAGERLSKTTGVRINVSKGPERVSLPSVVGLAQSAAVSRLSEVGLTPRVTEVFSEEPEGRVVEQRPASGVELEKGATVRLTVSKGPGLVAVPSLLGQRRPDAEAQLSSLGLEANVFLVPSIEPAGTVVAQHPTGGQVEKGSAVRLNVSNGQTPP